VPHRLEVHGRRLAVPLGHTKQPSVEAHLVRVRVRVRVRIRVRGEG
jgi:hypothetical protein